MNAAAPSFAVLFTSLAVVAQTAAIDSSNIESASTASPSNGSPSAYPGQWRQWRGPNRLGQVVNATWPDRLNTDNLKRQWRIELGPSYSGPVVSEELVFTTATEGKKKEVVTAADRRSGEIVWQVEWDGAMKVPFFAARNGSWIRSTPAYDGKSLFVAGMLDVLVSLDAKTGKENWKVDFTERFGSNRESFGFVCSPLVDGGAVVVQTGAGVVSLNKETGETLWRSMDENGGMMGGAFSSPIRAQLAGTDHLLVQSRSALCGLVPETGKVLWTKKVKTFRGMNILTPLPYGDTVFTSAYGGRGHLFGVTEADGEVSATEKWTTRAQAYMSTPVLIDGHAYVYLRSKRLCCVDLASGDVKWTSGSIADEYWSMVANGDRFLALTESGELCLLRANTEEFDLIDQVDVADSETWAHLAVDGDQILIRDLDGLSAFTWR